MRLPEPQQPNLDDLLADQDEREIKHRESVILSVYRKKRVEILCDADYKFTDLHAPEEQDLTFDERVKKSMQEYLRKEGKKELSHHEFEKAEQQDKEESTAQQQVHSAPQQQQQQHQHQQAQSSAPHFITVIYDFETTGRDPLEDRVVQIGAIVYLSTASGAQLGVPQCFKTLVNPAGRKMHPMALKTHNIQPNRLTKSPTFKCAWHTLTQRVNSVGKHQPATIHLIGHNSATFDDIFLAAELQRAHLPSPFGIQYPVVCGDTLKAVRAAGGKRHFGTKDEKLSTLYEKHTGQTLKNAHDAMVDCNAVMAILSMVQVTCIEPWNLRTEALQRRRSGATGNQSKVQPKEKGPTIKELEAELMKLGLKKSGRKAELVERLREYRASREPSKKRSALASPASPPHAASVKLLRQFSPAAQPVLEQRNKRKGISPLVIEVGEARPPTLDIGSPVVRLQPETQALQRTFDLTDTSNDTFEPTTIPTYYSLFHETDGMLHVDHQTDVLIIDTQAMHQLHLKGGLIAQTEGHFVSDVSNTDLRAERAPAVMRPLIGNHAIAWTVCAHLHFVAVVFLPKSQEVWFFDSLLMGRMNLTQQVSPPLRTTVVDTVRVISVQ